ncbi:MAG: hypothetical protein WCX46_01370 [Candidatus Paceibacterota bacterium]
MYEGAPKIETEKVTPETIIESGESFEKFNTIFRRIKKGTEENNIRIEKFNNFSPQMKEALSCVAKIFKDAKVTYPWAIHGSSALVLEGETTKKPKDIDLAFGLPDYEKVLEQIKKLEQTGKISDLKIEKMCNFKGNENGCIKIFAKIKTGEGEKDFIELEAFAQNVDPKQKKNGVTNPGLERTGINIYDMQKENETLEVNYSDRLECEKFYCLLAYWEAQEYRIDYKSIRKNQGKDKKENTSEIKNKFTQRLQNLISLIKRKEKEEFQKKFKNRKVAPEDELDFEHISDKNIDQLIEQFIKHNKRNMELEAADNGENRIDPIKLIKNQFDEFVNKRNKKNFPRNEGYINKKQRENNHNKKLNREEIIDTLTEESQNSMEKITVLHYNLDELIEDCEKDEKKCEPEKETILINEIVDELREIETIYQEYLNTINYSDNRDFIPFISINAMLEFVKPTLARAIELLIKNTIK